MTEKLKGWGAIIVSVLIFVVLAWWLIVVAVHLGDSPTVVNGAVTLDTFQRSKDILLVILPLTTTAVGFWLGNQGAGKAEESAEKAIKNAEHAGEQAVESAALMHDYRERAVLAEQKLSIIRSAALLPEESDIATVVRAVRVQEEVERDAEPTGEPPTRPTADRPASGHYTL